MKKNMGSTDVSIRFILAIAFFILVATKVITGIWAIVLVTVGFIFIVTSMISICPFYSLCRISTIKKKSEESNTSELKK